MSYAQLRDVFGKIRRITALGNSLQMPDFPPLINPPVTTPPTSAPVVALSDFVNSFYLYDFPADMRILKLKDLYTFDTIQGIDTYAFDSEHYTTVQQPAYCAHREIAFFNDPWPFYGVNFNWQFQEFFANSTGLAGPYSGNTQAFPLIRSVNNLPTSISYPISRVQNILITANTATSTLNVTDDGNGNLIGDCLAGGTINYQTGAIAGLTFTQVIPALTPQGGSNQIQIQYNPVVLSIPLSILFFQNQFTLRPVPDRGYTIQMVAYRQPCQALLGSASDGQVAGNTGTPELSEWWEALAFGGAMKIFQERGDDIGVAQMEKALEKQYDRIEIRTYAQLGKQRIQTLFADQLANNYGSSIGMFGNVGI